MSVVKTLALQTSDVNEVLLLTSRVCSFPFPLMFSVVNLLPPQYSFSRLLGNAGSEVNLLVAHANSTNPLGKAGSDVIWLLVHPNLVNVLGKAGSEVR